MMDFDDLDEIDPEGKSIFTGKRYRYPHAVIGAGQGGLRMALELVHSKHEDFVVFDRRPIIGGTAWTDNANPTTKVQTEFGTFHLNWSEKCQVPKGYSPWPSRDELLKHFNEVVDEEGVRPYLRLQTDVLSMNIIKDKEDPEEQHYELTLMNVATGKEEIFMAASMLLWPGNLTNPRRVTYKGEEEFLGPVNYGICSEVKYDQVTGKNVVIVGMGAFAIENVRTCVEYKAQKIYIVARRKNLCMPRMISWEINSSIWPMPASMVMRHMQKAYDMIGDDPWSYYAVQASKDRSNVTIFQKARFGIGDVFFLARYFGACEVVLGEVKSLSKDAVHLESGQTLEGIGALLKLLGFEPEWGVDKLMRLNEMKGHWVDGDYRRTIWSEAPMVNAQRFGGTSYSPGAWSVTGQIRHFLDHPADFKHMMNTAGAMIPVHKPDRAKGVPGYVIDARMASTMGVVIAGFLPKELQERESQGGVLKRAKQWATHSLEEVVEVASAEWKRYSQRFIEQGYDKPVPDYLYSVQEVQAFLKEQDDAGEALMIKMGAAAAISSE